MRSIFYQSLKQWLTEGKRGEDGNAKIWISGEQKELFRWNEKHFSKFLKDYHLVRNKILMKNSGHKLGWMRKDDSDKLWALYSGYKKIKTIYFPYLFVNLFKQRYTKSVKSYKYLNKFISWT